MCSDLVLPVMRMSPKFTQAYTVEQIKPLGAISVQVEGTKQNNS